MKTKTSASIDSTSSQPIKGADILVQALEREGVDVVFAYPGGASLEIHQALTRSRKIRTILPRHEQGGGFMAQGYARATGKVGVCMATSGPGATNLITSIADAFMDSIPLVAITGQVFQKFIGKGAFQETDFFGMTLPIVKHSYLVKDGRDLARIVKEAFIIAGSGRPGPVVIDIPKDVQLAKVEPHWDSKPHLPGLPVVPRAADEKILPILDLISKASKPVLYVGGGIVSSDAHAELQAFAERTGVPVATTLMAVGAMPENHPQCLRWFGMHGTVAGNWAVMECDLLVALGARFDDRITGVVDKFAPHATIVHVDVDASEHNKNKRVAHPIHSDVKHVLQRLNSLAESTAFHAPDLSAWWTEIRKWQRDYPFSYEKGRYLCQQEVIETLHRLSGGKPLITTGVGQHQMWAAQFFPVEKPRQFISSLGLGTMGFGLPAAIGVKVACPDSEVIDIDGDGSFMMNIQELATMSMEKIPVKVVLLNNQHLGMVVQWEDRFHAGNRAHTYLGPIDHPEAIGQGDGIGPDVRYPDFVAIAKGFGCGGGQVTEKAELVNALREMIDYEGTYVLDVQVPYQEHVLPMIPAGMTVKDLIK